jgi:hypothetical protein
MTDLITDGETRTAARVRRALLDADDVVAPEDAHVPTQLMRASELQEAVTESILNDEADRMKIGMTDSRRGVTVEANGLEAVYEADHARQLADAMEENPDAFEVDPTAMAEYLRELAQIADATKGTEEVLKEWGERDFNGYDPNNERQRPVTFGSSSRPSRGSQRCFVSRDNAPLL